MVILKLLLTYLILRIPSVYEISHFSGWLCNKFCVVFYWIQGDY
jgi:hypothetical protein